MCCGQVGGVVGVVGGLLLLLGLIQLASGICFLLILPIFQLGSNIWTGSWSGVCGLVLGVIGWKKQTIKRGQLILVATLSVLVANVANLVILQVGEYGVFLTADARRNIVENNLEYIVKIAFWLTTIVTALGIVISFFGAQYLFCVVVRGPKMKGRLAVTRSLSEEGLHHRQVETTRFQSPCLTASSNLACDDLTLRVADCRGVGGGTGASGNVHGFLPGGGGGDNVLSGNSSSGSRGTTRSQENKEEYTEPQQPKTPENCVPYFLRNHRSAWQFILPDVVKEMRENERFSGVFSDSHSRTSTLSKVSKSSFQPFKPDSTHSGGDRPQILGTDMQNGGMVSRAPSSCNTSLYSIPESLRQSSASPRPPGSRLVRPSAPPPAPPTVSTSANLRSLTTGGWESCAVIEYPSQGGGGFVVDLD